MNEIETVLRRYVAADKALDHAKGPVRAALRLVQDVLESPGVFAPWAHFDLLARIDDLRKAADGMDLSYREMSTAAEEVRRVIG